MTVRRRALLVAAVAGSAVAAFLALAGGTAWLLRSDWLLGQIDASPESLFVTFTGPRASLVPGRIRFATLTLRSRDSNVEWEAVLEDVSVDVALPALARRRFHAKTVRAAGLTFRLRERLTRAEATPARVARYPRIDGFPGPPLLAKEDSRPPGDPWTVAVDDLRVAAVSGIWIDAWRWEGEAALSGRFHLRSGIEAAVPSGELAVAKGTLHWGPDVVSRETAGRVGARLPRFETKAYPGNEIWKIMSGAAALDGTLDAVPFLAPERGRAPLAGGGNVRARVEMEGGRGGGTLSVRMRDARPLVALLPPGPPAWVAGLVDLHDFGAVAHGRIAPGTLAISPVHAEAGTLSLDADWHLGGGREWGALLVRKGILSLGLGLGDAATPMRLVGATSWFEAEGQPGGLRTAQPRDSAGATRLSR